MPSHRNPAQQDAISSSTGTVIINAGPGTGKTYTLVSRIINLIKAEGVNPNQILALTFTEKAADEIKKRIQKEMNEINSLPFIGTFHAFGYQVLSKQNIQVAIISEKRRKAILKECLEDEKLKSPLRKFDIKELSLTISCYKNQPPNIQKIYFNYLQYKNFISNYKKKLQEVELLDFDDLLLKTYKILKENNSLQKQYQDQYKHILVDEFQDTNPMQFEIIKLLADQHTDLFVIGDPLQSIYSFRGATPNIFKILKQEFPEFHEITLDKNYRSSSEILKVSHRLFPSSTKLQANSKISGEVKLITTLNEYTEADFVVNEIDKKVGGTSMIEASNSWEYEDKQARFSDFAIMYRLHFLSRTLQNKFKASGIPYQVIGSASIYEKPEISFIISCLEFVYNQHDEPFLEILESKFTNLSDQILRKLTLPLTCPKDLSFKNEGEEGEKFKRAKNILSQKELPFRSHKKLQTLVDSLQKLIEKSKELKLYELIEYMVIQFNFDKLTDKQQLLNEFKSIVLRFDRYGNSLERFVNYFQNFEKNDFYDNEADKVTLLTMHASKGLEFKYIFICGFEEGFIPYLPDDIRGEQFDEEKRLFYIALTRAKTNAYIINVKTRAKQQKNISEFAQIIQGEYLQKLDDEIIGKKGKKELRLKQKRSQIKMF